MEPVKIINPINSRNHYAVRIICLKSNFFFHYGYLYNERWLIKASIELRESFVISTFC